MCESSFTWQFLFVLLSEAVLMSTDVCGFAFLEYAVCCGFCSFVTSLYWEFDRIV